MNSILKKDPSIILSNDSHITAQSFGVKDILLSTNSFIADLFKQDIGFNFINLLLFQTHFWLLINLLLYSINSILPIIYIILPTYYGKPIWFAVNVTQHLAAAIDKKDHRLSTYSLKLNPILSFLYWKMEYHLEHHMFPMVPSYNLKKLNSEIKTQLPKQFNGLYDFYYKILPSVIKLATNPEGYFKVNLQSNNK